MVTAAAALVLALPASATTAPRASGDVLAVSWQAGGGRLARVDALTLQPVGSRYVNVGGASMKDVARSPDGALRAFGAPRQIRLVDTARMRMSARIPVGHGFVTAATWPEAGRLIAVVSDSRSEVVTVDVTRTRIAERRHVGGPVLATAARPGALVLLLAPPSGIGPVRLARVENDGDVRSVHIPGVTGGFAATRGHARGARQQTPALAVDDAGRRAFVIAPRLAVEVDLRTLHTWRHELRRSLSSARMTAKTVVGWSRTADWVDARTIAVAGTDFRAGASTPAGLSFLEVGSWTLRLVAPGASSLARVGTRVLAYGGGWDPSTRRQTGAGLVGLRRDGVERFHLFGATPVTWVQLAGAYAYVGSSNSTRFEIVNPATGAIVGRAQTARPTVIFDP